MSDNCMVFVVHGALDLANAPSLLTRGRRAIGSCGRLAVDLEDVDVLDAIGIGVLLGLRKAAKDSGADFVLVAASAAVSASLEAHEVDRLFATHTRSSSP